MIFGPHIHPRLRQLVDLAQLDIASITIQLGIDAQEANNFKQTFGQLGSLFVQQGLGFNSFQPQQQPV